MAKFSIMDHDLWERPFLDLWTVPHALLGVLVAAGAVAFGLGMFWGWVIVTIAALVWEGFEFATGISKTEMPTNSISDIVVALIGYAVALPLLARLGEQAFAAVTAVSVIVFIVVNVLGWAAFARHRNGGV